MAWADASLFACWRNLVLTLYQNLCECEYEAREVYGLRRVGQEVGREGEKGEGRRVAQEVGS